MPSSDTNEITDNGTTDTSLSRNSDISLLIPSPVKLNVEPLQLESESLDSRNEVPSISPILSDTNQITDNVTTETSFSRNCDAKKGNALLHEIKKRQKHVQVLQRKIKTSREKLIQLEGRRGHYSVRNVNKRDEISRQNMKKLRETQQTLRKTTKLNETLREKVEKLKGVVKAHVNH